MPFPLLQDMMTEDERKKFQDANMLAQLLNQPAYTDFFEPILKGMMERWLRELADPSEKRKVLLTDDYLRGGIAVARALLNAPYHFLDAVAARAKEVTEERKEEAHYRRLAGYSEETPGERQP